MGQVPDIIAGDLFEAASLNRYRWVMGVLPVGEVLLAGRELARGATLLSDGGRRKVVAVDPAREVLEAAMPLVPAHVTLQQADVHSLPFESRRFHGVVAFELLDHVHDPLRALDELTRVLRTDGILAISVSNQETANGSPARSPGPPELVDALRARFPHVGLSHECPWMASAILTLDDPGQSRDLVAPVAQVSGRLRPEAAPTLLLLASMQPLASPAGALVLAHPVDSPLVARVDGAGAAPAGGAGPNRGAAVACHSHQGVAGASSGIRAGRCRAAAAAAGHPAGHRRETQPRARSA